MILNELIDVADGQFHRIVPIWISRAFGKIIYGTDLFGKTEFYGQIMVNL